MSMEPVVGVELTDRWTCSPQEALVVYMMGYESDTLFQARDPFVAELAAVIASVADFVSAFASDERRS